MSKAPPWVWFAAGVLAAVTIGASNRPALAQTPRTATCITLSGVGLGGQKDAQMGQVTEGWVNTQLAAGKNQLFSATMRPDASLICAW